ncbi:hypothetical protein NX722_15265 [Endozoicomonas gorgoniicola]|uniref:Uncharacterized protein n=1 Tax=Endozoicomonas gorgoniicola TaxID=1234144 RepID=A0ABT3MX45_9GAMM|nr:hypothetical protein [Endozoicomonas gorgoniicola]MCW7553956.1 hypothetical protein [Endozoicomonas gorgoniicola]
MTDIINTSVPFWPEQKVAKYDSEIPLLYREENNYLDKNWPDNGPSQDQAIDQLKNVKKGWISSFKLKNKDSVMITLLISKYKVNVSVGNSNGNSRLWLSRIFFANNQDRQRMLENGALVSFDGLSIMSNCSKLTGKSTSTGQRKLS